MNLVPVCCEACGVMVAEATIEDGQPITPNVLIQAPPIGPFAWYEGAVLCLPCAEAMVG